MSNQPIAISTLISDQRLGGEPVPAGLIQTLEQQGLKTLQEVRRKGGIAVTAEMTPEAKKVLQKIEAHADFSLISDDLKVNDCLVKAGFRSTADIGQLPKSTFMERAKQAGVNENVAVVIQAKAVAVSAYLANVVAETRVAEANHQALQPLLNRQTPGLPAAQPFDERESAVSPLAYLAALLEYTSEHVSIKVGSSTRAITLRDLENQFYQPLGRFSVNDVDRKVRQIRICIEVLRAYIKSLQNTPGISPEALAQLQQQEKVYLFEAYKTLLNQLGTSYETIRLVKTAKPEDRQKLGDRIGIAPEHLDQLYLTPDNADALKVLNEQNLERLFGLVNTTRDPLSDGVQVDPLEMGGILWKFTGIQWNRNTDLDGHLHIALTRQGQALTVNVYRNSNKAVNQLVASGTGTYLPPTPSTPSPGYVGHLTEQNHSGLSGTFRGTTSNTELTLSIVPDFLCWRLQHLRDLWKAQDWPSDLFQREILPLIDPDLIGPDDFRCPEPNNPAFSLWEKRRKQVDDQLKTLHQERQANGLNFILQKILGSPLPDLDALLRNLKTGKAPEETAKHITGLGLSIESFTRLMEIRTQHQAATAVGSKPVTDAEWQELYSILVQVSKETHWYSQWQQEEQAERYQLKLSSGQFWMALREPQEGDWPPIQTDARIPWIDPDLLKVTDLPESTLGKRAVALWTVRKDQLAWLYNKLQTKREVDGFEALLDEALGLDSWSSRCTQLYQDLQSLDENQVKAATIAIQTELCMTVEDFTRLMEVKLRQEQAEAANQPKDSDWAAVYGILTRSHKVKFLYVQWLQAERGLEYWRLLKARLPRWRASLTLRQQWQRALKNQSEPAVIDPDLIAIDDLENSSADSPTHQLLQARTDFLAQQKRELEAIYREKAAWSVFGSTFAVVNTPSGIAVDSQGNIYVTDVQTSRVHKFDAAGKFIATWGTPGSSNGQFRSPQGIAICRGPRSIDVYVVDSGNHRVQKFDASGNYLAQWGAQGPGKGQFNSPGWIAIDGQRNIYVVDSGNNRIQKFDSDGGFITTWGTPGFSDGQFRNPRGIAIDNQGNIYIADSMLHRVQKFNASGGFLAKWGSQGTGDGQFKGPVGITIDSQQRICVVDNGNHRIQAFNTSGTFLHSWGSRGQAPGQFRSPQGIVADGQGNLYVADNQNRRVQQIKPSDVWGIQGFPAGVAIDNQVNAYITYSGNHRIQKVDASGNLLFTWGTPGSNEGQFQSPQGIAIDNQGNIYVVDSGNHRVQKFDASGNYLAQWGAQGPENGQFKSPGWIAIDRQSNIYVVDSGNCRIQKFNSSGRFIATWGTQGINDGQFQSPQGIAIDNQGNIYIADSMLHRIQKFNADGGFLTKWGSEGTADDLQFKGPVGITIDSQQRICVVDNGNHRIRAFDTSGTRLLHTWGSQGQAPGQFNFPQGIAADNQGNLYVADNQNRRVQVIGDSTGFRAIIQHTLGISSGALVNLYQGNESGDSISARLDQLNLSMDELHSLMRGQRLLAAGENLSESDWDEIYAVLVRVKKRRTYAEWQAEERASGILLSPDYFHIPATEPENIWQISAFRMARQEWQDRLNTRIAQEQTTAVATAEAVNTCEEATLAILRNALIDAAIKDSELEPVPTDFAIKLAEKARILSERFLIDCRISASQKTTRVSQSLTTLQNLIFSLRTGQLNSHPNLTLVEDENFDTEWLWIGSYEPWKAATGVFLYPENILLPSLRRQKTPAFRELVEALRNNPRLTPQGARNLASTYAEYLNNIRSLKVQATCTAETRVNRDENSRPLFYMFGLGGVTNRVYWSTYDSTLENTGYAQTFWQEVPVLENVIEVIGAVPYEVSTEEHYIYLFVLIREKTVTRLAFIRYNLENSPKAQRWDSECTFLEPPETATAFTVVIKQRDRVEEPPHLAIRLPNGTIYDRYLNNKGDAWAGDQWKPLVGSAKGQEFSKLCAMVEIAPNEFCLKVIPSYLHPVPTCQIKYRIFGNKDDGYWRDAIFGVGEFLGVFSMPSTLSKIYCFVTKYDSPSVSRSTYCALEFRPYRFILNINSFNSFDDWLQRVTGLSLKSIQIPEHIRASANPSWPTDIFRILSFGSGDVSAPSGLREYQMQCIDWLEEEIKGTENYFDLMFGQWKLVNEHVQTNTNINIGNIHVDGKSLTEVLKELLDRKNIGFRSRSSEWGAVPEGELLGERLLPGFNSIAPTCDLRNNANPTAKYVCYQKVGVKPGIYRCNFTNDAGGWLSPSISSRVTPYVENSLEIKELLSQQELQEHYAILESAVAENIANPLVNPQCNLTYLEEAFYFVPVALALALQRSGQYTSALDWYRTVYDYARPVNRRKVYYGLKREEGYEPGYDRGNLEAWLQDPLDVHRIASTRCNAYTRFTLISLIRCLLAYADAEFTRDTVESLATAKTLYETAFNLIPELLDAPQSRTGLRTSVRTQPIPAIDTLLESKQTRASQISQALLTNETIEQGMNRLAKAVGQASNPPLLAQRTALMRHLLNVLDGFYVPQNPIFQILAFQAINNLYKLWTGRNIAGVKRDVEPYAAPIDILSAMPSIGAGGQLVLATRITPPPVPYRYEFLVERAKQLANLAAQMEGAFLSTLEKRDAELYNLLKARQDIRLARAGVRLQDLRLRQAEDEVQLAELQKESAEIQIAYYQGLLDSGINEYELMSLVLLGVAADFYLHSAIASLIAVTMPSSVGVGGATYSPQGALGSAASSLSSQAMVASTISSILSTLASYERRAQEWEFQKELAQQSLRIGDQQIKIANDGVDIVEQEGTIARIQVEHAEAIVEFLQNKETNLELYDWMSGILEGIYSYFLQQATAMAKLAQAQLAFERQQLPPAYIQDDYWEVPSEDAIGGASEDATDRHGLTGSARLLADIYKLDQYRLETEQRKLQLTKVISLARTAPFEFQRFKETGVLVFATPMEGCDRDFPGHYLRLIKRVRTSVIALIPPTEGIKATLTSIGISRVVVNNDGLFQPRFANRSPESVALTSPTNATGLFELETQSEMLLPFEGLGVDTTWEFRLPKAANRFDYSTIADILIAIEYTALDSYDYRQQVIQTLPSRLSGDRPFSFKNQFADQWYDLHNPERTDAPMTVRFRTGRADFPPNLDSLKIQQVLLYFARRSGETFEVTANLTFKPDGEAVGLGGETETVDGIISTRRGNAGSWMLLVGQSPFGEWTLSLPNTEVMKQRFRDEKIEDILFVITYAGRVPEWPA